MKGISTLPVLLTLAGALSLQAQQVTVSVGAAYANQAYYTIADDAVTTLSNESWDIAFSIAPGDAGVFINEATKSVMSGTIPDIRLWLAPTVNFADVIDPADLVDSLYNKEENWANGAFNSLKEDSQPEDYGWGYYNSVDDKIVGFWVFALKLRNGTWKKIFIESLDQEVYTLKYADLDGANETVLTIDKADFAGSPLAYYSFATGQATASPAGWDLLFTRYMDELNPDANPVQYLVTGVLSGPGVEVAEANGVDPYNVAYEPYLDSLDTHLDVIGQDWKYFDLTNFVWVIDPDRAFFAKLANNELWRIVLTGFGGSSNGNFVFDKEYLGQLSGVEDQTSNFSGFGVFPNPAAEQITLGFSLKESREQLPLRLVNAFGQEVWQGTVSADVGLNIIPIDRPQVPGGIYYLRMGEAEDFITFKISLLSR